MTGRNLDRIPDRITLRHAARPGAARGQAGARADRRRHVWTLMGGVAGSLILFWVMVQLGPASSDAQTTAPISAAAKSQPVTEAASDGAGEEKVCAGVPPAVPVAQGPAIDTPREMIDMLDLRKKDLDRREQTVRLEEARLLALKSEVESLLAKSEAMQQRMEEARQQAQKQAAAQKAQQEQAVADRKASVAKQSQEQKAQSQAQLAKMYESMPAEDAAARLEQMPERKAVEMLRLVKGKTAGAILSQMKAERAAKLTEQLLAPAP